MDTFAHAGHNVTTGTIQAQSEASTLLFVYFTFETHSIHTLERDLDPELLFLKSFAVNPPEGSQGIDDPEISPWQKTMYRKMYWYTLMIVRKMQVLVAPSHSHETKQGQS